MGQKKWFILSYDIRDSKRLRMVARKMEGNGKRLQYSVFRCRLTERELERLRWELSRIMKEEDELMVLHLCDRCVEHCRVDNPRMSWPERTPTYKIV